MKKTIYFLVVIWLSFSCGEGCLLGKESLSEKLDGTWRITKFRVKGGSFFGVGEIRGTVTLDFEKKLCTFTYNFLGTQSNKFKVVKEYPNAMIIKTKSETLKLKLLKNGGMTLTQIPPKQGPMHLKKVD